MRYATESNTKPSSVQAILAALRTSITYEKSPPGTVLRQVELAEEFGVGRIPVREALQSEGLVLIDPNRGDFVASCTAERLSEMFDLPVLLEVDALQHQQLIAAVRNGDTAAASAILTLHLRQTQQSALASLRSPSTRA